jgi:hypothetical protein
VALSAVAGLATGTGVRATSHRPRLAEAEIPGLLATRESGRQAGPSCHLQRRPGLDPGHVASEPDLGLASDRGRTPVAGDYRGHIDGREVSTAGPQATITDVESLREQSREGHNGL